MSASDDIRILQKQVYDLKTSSAALAGSSTQVFSVASPTNVAHAVPLGFFAPITNSLGADVLLNNVTLYFDGPSVAQGAVGTWYVSGTVCMSDSTAGTLSYTLKLWDGTTLIDSKFCVFSSTLTAPEVTLSGFLPNPAGNLKISVKNLSTTTGKIIYNGSGLGKDSTITAFRIG